MFTKSLGAYIALLLDFAQLAILTPIELQHADQSESAGIKSRNKFSSIINNQLS